MKKRQIATLCIVTVLALFATNIHAQTATINIKGFITDESTNKPIGKDMDMVLASKNTGKKFTVKINSKTGEYLQPVTSGDTYTITIASYAVFKKVEILEIPPTGKYREERHDYKVKSIIQGQPIMSASAFDTAQSAISPTASAKMQELLEIIKQNRELNVVVEVAQEQFPPPPAPSKKDLKAKKPVKGKKGVVEAPAVVADVVPPNSINTKLYDARIEELKKFFSQAKNSDIRIKYAAGASMAPAPGQNNLTVSVGEVKSILDE